MIARIKFDGVVKDSEKKTSMSDHIDIHSVDLETAKSTFERWVSTGVGIKGDSGVFHPIGSGGEIKFKKIEEVK